MASAAIEPLSALPVSTELLQRAVDLVPVPAIHVLRHADGWDFMVYNQAYRLAGLGVVADRSPMLRSLAERIEAFLDSSELRADFDWTIGEAIDCRYYRVTIARSSLGFADRCALTFVDQTSQIHTERSLRREMTTDSLTGLPNREGFSDLIEAIHADRARHAVLVVDLHRFGRFNACLGGLAGDELLITVARRLRGALRARDTLARIGGDEFGILMASDGSADEPMHLADRIRAALAAPFRLSSFELNVDCSIGAAIGSDAVDDPEELIRHAQFALKRAKTSGQVEFYQSQAFTIANEQFAMETALRHAIENRRLRLSYQPICALDTGQVVSFEALARWCDDEGREVMPSRFIPVAEESGLIMPLGRWAIDEATQALADWDRRAGGHCGVGVAVNLSPLQLHRDSVVEVVENALDRAGLAGDRLKLELTESALVTDPDRTAAIMRALKALGTTIAMDDFGTGYSNLAFLQALPIDILKIDRSFVTGMLADRDKIAIVRAVLSLAQALNMRTVAEGVESLELAQTLAGLGCTFGQGYYYARPLEADAAYALIAPAAASA